MLIAQSFARFLARRGVEVAAEQAGRLQLAVLERQLAGGEEQIAAPARRARSWRRARRRPARLTPRSASRFSIVSPIVFPYVCALDASVGGRNCYFCLASATTFFKVGQLDSGGHQAALAGVPSCAHCALPSLPFSPRRSLLRGAGLAAAVPLAPHRAVYDLTLDKASDSSGITGIPAAWSTSSTARPAKATR